MHTPSHLHKYNFVAATFEFLFRIILPPIFEMVFPKNGYFFAKNE